MNISRIRRLVERAEAMGMTPSVEDQLRASGLIEVDGAWVNPRDFIDPGFLILWAREFHDAWNRGAERTLARLAESWDVMCQTATDAAIAALDRRPG